MAKVEAGKGGCASLPLLPMLLLLGAGWFAVQQGHASGWLACLGGQALVADAQEMWRVVTGERDRLIPPSSPLPRKLALLSVSDKTGLEPCAQRLVNGFGYSLVSSSGTAKAFQAAGIPVTKISDDTHSPEILGDRTKGTSL